MNKRRVLSILLVLSMVFALSACGKKTETPTVEGQMKPGTYTSTVDGHNGKMTVEVKLSADKIEEIKVTEHVETGGIGDIASTEIPKEIVASQNLDVDLVSGATVSSNAIIEAVKYCISEAGGNPEDFIKAKEAALDGDKGQAEDVVCDTVVIGAGGAGMSTAIALKRGGQNVILVEKQPMVGGATSLAATYFVSVDTSYHKEAGMTQSIENYVAGLKEKNPDYNEENFTRLLENTEESLTWLNELGANITRPISDYQIATADGSSIGVEIVKALKKDLEAQNVDCRLNTKALNLIEENGQIKGVVVENKDEKYNILADNVVVATGGFATGAEALEKFVPEWKDVPSTSAVGSSGDGAFMVEEIGGALSNMDVVRLNPSVYSNGDVNVSLSAARAEGGIMVNANGQRFCNDYYPDYTQLSKWMMEQEGGKVFIMIDQVAMDKSKRLQDFDSKGYFLKADTIEELAEKMEVPVENLVETIERYKGFVASGVDEDFGRGANLSIDFTAPPYYAAITTPGLQVTLGGIKVDSNMHIVKEDGQIFDNLFAIGECADDGTFGGAPTNVNVTFGRLLADYIMGK